MSRDLRLPLREALIGHLRQYAPLTDLVPALAIHGERVPAKQSKPFISLSRLEVEAFDASCIRGGIIPIRLNVFTEGEDSGPITKISATLVDALDDAQLTLDGGWCLDITFVRITPVPVGSETTSWHDLVNFTALTGVGD